MDRPSLGPALARDHGGDVYARGREFNLDANEIMDFSASINPLGPPAAARRAFARSYREISRYPEPYGERLRDALAKRHDLAPNEILLGNGSTQLIYLICQTLKPRDALVIAPAFSEYENALRLSGAKTDFLVLRQETGFRLLLDRFLAAWTPDFDVAFLSTPNGATGTPIPKTEIAEIARTARETERFVVIDEAFVDFIEDESVKKLIQENPFLIVLRSLTKYYALPGLRLGYLLAHARTLAHFAARQEPWSVNGPAQRVALACLADADFRSRTRRWLAGERDFLLRGLSRLPGLRPYPSSANFLLVSIENLDFTAAELRFALLRRRILIRACDSFLGLGPRYFRVAVRRRKENRTLVQALATCIDGQRG
jgi:threonine-phosphate decarboxylase